MNSPTPKPTVVVVMPAYNAARTLERTYRDIPLDLVTHVIVVDDHSHDDTSELASRLGLRTLRHHRNLGYGANQKTCYREALNLGADVVVMVHADHQYDPTRIPQLVQPILDGQADFMLGTRIADGKALEGGMPIWKFISNRILTTFENLVLGQKLTDLHTGMRAYSRRLLETVPWWLNSDDFVFDSEMIAQGVACGFRLAETPVPARYFDEASSVNFKVSLRYGLATVGVMLRFLLHRLGLRRSDQFVPARADAQPPVALAERYEVYSPKA
ncbi:MAG: glycosyltransferase family 2 protein [Candidatus Flexifilum sp.]|jgi:glycosyltransferase involved in cell wall biosynthesis